MGLLKILAFRVLVITFTVFLFGQSFESQSQETSEKNYNISFVVEYFSESNPDSKVSVDHSSLTEMLEETVLPMGKATKRLGWKGETEEYKSSKLKLTINSSPSRYEGNRLMIHAFRDGHRAFFLSYQKGLENLSKRRPLKTWPKDEQLAFWLNLHNVIVLNKLIDEYPVSSLKKLRKNSNSFWAEKATQVEGISLSLEEIEKIVMNNWPGPLAIYGFWQGSIGGPSLQRQAFTGKNVWKQLRKIAKEFINSNRGFIPRENFLEVSLFFKWTAEAFGGSDFNLLNHIRSFANPPFLNPEQSFEKIVYKYYDWQIVDLIGGNYYTGNQNAQQMQTRLGVQEIAPPNLLLDLPPQALEMFIEMFKEIERVPGFITPLVTSEECAPETECIPNPEK